MLNSFRAKTNCELEAKFVQDRITLVEKNVSELCDHFAQYSRKVAKLRDKNDEIAKAAINYVENEQINKSLAVGLENFADSLTILADYGDARVQIIDTKVVNEFARYEDLCKHVKDEVRDIYSARDKEVNRKRQLERIKERNPRNRQQIIQAETDLVKATADVSRTVHNFEEKVTTFERQKIHDIKSVLLDFISTEMGYHAKALEILTRAYKDINNVDEESDLEEFKKSLRLPEASEHRPSTSLFKSGNRFGSLGAIFSTTHNKRTPGIPNSSQLSKSEETLDSMKHSISDSEEEISENSMNTEEKIKPVARRFRR